jgi:hypothetical protein
MKRKLTFLLTALLLLTGMTSWGQTRTQINWVAADQGYSNGQTIESVDFDSNVSGSFFKGTNNNNPPKYYSTGSAIRCYGGNYFTITTSDGNLTEIALTFASGEGTNAITTDVGTYSDGTWTGAASSVTFTIGGTSGHRRIAAFDITYGSGGGQQQETVAIPTFNPAGGTYYEPQSVTISCATQGATIYYTTDGNEPTENSQQYSIGTSLNISETTTLKAKAFKSGYIASTTATATYTFPSVVNISSITAAGSYTVQGTIVAKSARGFIVGDGTGYVYYYNQNYSQSSYNIGDMVKLSGSVVVYGGVFEFNSTATITAATSSNYVAEEPTIITGAEMDSRVASTTPAQLSNYVQYEGTLSISGTHYNITDIDGATTAIGSISYPISTDFTSLEGQEVVVKGYYVGISTSTYYNTMLGSIEENVVTNPQLTVAPTELSGFQYTYNAGPSQALNFSVTGNDLTSSVSVTAPQNFEVSINSDGPFNNTVTLSPTAGTLNAVHVYVRMKSGLEVGSYSGNITLASGTLNASVALSGTVSELLVAETPVFSPASGNYLTAQTVSISCPTTGASIHYTTDGSDPTENSPVYSAPLTVSVTTTIKAVATATGYANSAIAEATYNINETITIAEARALEIDEYGCVEGTVTFIDNRNVYVQDATAGIVLFLNNNTVPSTLAIGDNVRAYGKRAVYNGLVELSGINGNDPNKFMILSSNNSLPLAVKTIAEINADFSGNNMLQSTRVKIVDAIIGVINTNGNTELTQEGNSNSINIYRIPNVEGLTQGDLVTVTGVIGCFNAVQLRVVNASDVLYEHHPFMTATPTSLSGFTYDIEEGGPSAINHIELAGDYLVGPVQVYPSESFEVSTLGDELFQSENPANIYNPGSFYGIKVYVRMKAGLEAGTYEEQLTAVSEGADTLYINVSGTVTGETPTPPDPPTPPTPGDGNYVRISDLNSLTDSSYVIIAARFDDNASDYYAMTAATTGKPTGVLFTSATSGSDEVLPASIVDEESNYYWVVGVTDNGYTFTNAAGELIGYGASGTDFVSGGEKTEWVITLETAGESAMVPGYNGFYITNATTTNRGFALNNNHNYGAYATSNNNGSGYNFYLDFFVKTEGGEPPVPTVATPTFTPESGTYYEEQSVSIACATEGATIYYTLDGSDPSENSLVYSAPLDINQTTTIKAIAMKEGYNNSSIAEASYTIQIGVVTIFNQDWEGEMNGWTFIDVEGEMSWSIASYQGNHYAYANGYNHGANIDWCISPVFNLDAISNPTLSFRTAMKFTGNDLEVFFSNDYDGEDPTEATWTALNCALSTGNYEWVESGDIDLSSFNGTACYIGFKYTCEESAAAAWEVDDITLVGMTSDPVVNVTPLALNGFSYTEGNGPSDEQSFTVAGFNLSGNIIISEASHYEISLASGDDFAAQSVITLNHSNGTIEETTIYVRLKAGLAVGNYNDEDITITCSDVDDIEVTCNGSVTAQPVPGDDYVRISDVGALAAGNRVILAARYNETANAYLAIANAPTSGKLTTTEFTSEMNGSEEIIPASILSDEDSHYWTVDVTADGYTFTNANGDMIGYGNNGTNLVLNGEKTVWTIDSDVSSPESLVPDYFGFNIANATTETRAMALRVTETESVVKAYSTGNMTNGEYNFFLDIFMQGEGGVPPTPTVAAPTFNPVGGTYYETQDVTISCAIADATIYYSLDSENGPWEEYEEAITVDESMILWAYATKEGYNDSPIVSAEYVIQNGLDIIFNQDWEEDWHGWTEVCVEGDSLWRIASYQGNHYAYANGYNHPASEDWLISPTFDLDSYNDVVLTFRTAKNYTGEDIKVYFSNDYDGQDPTAATWEELDCELSEGGWNWVESGEISFDEFSGSNCYIGFKYTCIDEEAAGWEVDDIMLVSGGGNTNPTLTATPNTINGLDYIEGEGPSNSQSYTLTGSNLVGEGDVTLTASENFEISLNDEDFFTTLYVQYADGLLVDQPVTIFVRLAEGLDVDTYEGTITHEGGEASTVVSVTGTVHSEEEPAIEAFMPMYIQGNNGSNNNRVPVATSAYIFNLEPNTTYRYTNQFVDANDGPETAGAGNIIYANPEGFYRSTSPSLSTEGGYGEFTTDEVGSAFVWFINEPTANARFTPGNQVYLRIRINDGHDGTTVDQAFTTEDYATVLNYGTEYDEYSASAFYAKSNEPAMTFAMLLADQEDERPIYSTCIETVGVDYGSINQYADFYKELVAGNDGWFGGILPNDNKDGINAIWIVDRESNIVNTFAVEDGQWQPNANTINPNTGLDEPIFIDLTDDGVEEGMTANVKVWSADHEFVIENGDNTHYTMTVYNVLGQPMMMKQINAGSTERISHSLATGVYVISLQNNQNAVSVKVIVK